LQKEPNCFSGRTERHGKDNTHFSQLCEQAYKTVQNFNEANRSLWTYTCGLENSSKIIHKEMVFHGLVLIGVVPDLQQWQNLVKLIIKLVIQ